MREIFAHPRHDQRMGIACDNLRKPANARAPACITRQQRRIGMRLIEIFDDCQRFEKNGPIAVYQRRNRHHRIDGAEFCLALLALHRIDVDDLIGLYTFEIERDAHAVGRQRAPERKQFHGIPPILRLRPDSPRPFYEFFRAAQSSDLRAPAPSPNPRAVASSKPLSAALVARMSAPRASPVSTIVRRSFTPLAMLNVVGPGSRPSNIVTIMSARFFMAGLAPLVSTKRSSSRLGSQPAALAMAK